MYARDVSDYALRAMERVVAQDPLDAGNRIKLYYERYRAGLTGVIRPTLPLLPRPRCFGATKPHRCAWRRELVAWNPPPGFTGVMPPLGVNPDDPFGVDDYRYQNRELEPHEVRNSDFTGKRSVLLTDSQLGEVSRYLIATIGQLNAYNAWIKWGVTPAPGVEVCLGLAIQVAGGVENEERGRFNEEDRARKKAEEVRRRGEVAQNQAVRRAEDARLLEQLQNGTLQPTRAYASGSYEDEVLRMVAVVREEKIARRLAGGVEPEDRDHLVEPLFPPGSWRQCAVERGRECVDRTTMDELEIEAGTDDEILELSRKSPCPWRVRPGR